MGGSFFVGNGVRIEALAKPIFVRAQPFNGSGTAALARIQNHCVKSGKLCFFLTNSGSVYCIVKFDFGKMKLDLENPLKWGFS